MPPQSLTVRSLIAMYLRHSASEKVHGEAARQDRERNFALFVEAYGDMPVADCRPFHLTDFIERHSAWKSSSTRKKVADAVRAAFNWGLDQERIDRNPFRKVKYAEAERRPDMPDQVLGKLEHLANKQYERALRFLRLTGCRLTELCEARWPDIDLERGLWTIPKHKARRFTCKPKIVALVAAAVELLKSIRPDDPGDNHVFVNNRGKPWSRRTLGQQFRRMKKRHGIVTPASLHGIRHRFGSAAVAAGAPLKLVSAQLGHTSTVITERYYVDLAGEVDALRQAAEKAIPRPAAS